VEQSLRKCPSLSDCFGSARSRRNVVRTIGDVLAISLGTVKSRITRGRAACARFWRNTSAKWVRSWADSPADECDRGKCRISREGSRGNSRGDKEVEVTP